MSTSTGVMASHPFVGRVALFPAGSWAVPNRVASSWVGCAYLVATAKLVHEARSPKDRPLETDRPIDDRLRLATIPEIPEGRRPVAAPPRAAQPQPGRP